MAMLKFKATIFFLGKHLANGTQSKLGLKARIALTEKLVNYKAYSAHISSHFRGLNC